MGHVCQSRQVWKPAAVHARSILTDHMQQEQSEASQLTTARFEHLKAVEPNLLFCLGRAERAGRVVA